MDAPDPMIPADAQRVLIIEDARANIQLVGDLLKDLAQISFALTGEAGLAQAKRLRPDLILLDIGLPDLDGYAVLDRLKADPDTTDIPIIFLTARSTAQDEAHGLTLGAIDYIAKPFHPIVVRARVQNHLRLRYYSKRLHELNGELHQLASTDQLTGLPNRRAFLEAAAKEFARFQRYATPTVVMMLDLDHFKAINDRYGHHGGDRVLQAVSTRLATLLRESDTIGRLGGEEFGIIVPHATLDDGVQIAERILDLVRATAIPLEDTPVSITLSIGLSRLTPNDSSFERALRRADQALYEAKARGRDQLVGQREAPSP